MASGPPPGNFSQGPGAISNGPPIGAFGPGNAGASNPYRSKGRRNMYQATGFFKDMPSIDAVQQQSASHGITGAPSQQPEISAGFSSYPTQRHTEVGTEFRPIIPDSVNVDQRTGPVPGGPAFSSSHPALSQHAGSQLSPSPLQRSHQSAFRNVNETPEEHSAAFQETMAHTTAFEQDEMQALGRPLQQRDMSDPFAQQKPQQGQNIGMNVLGMEQQFSQLSLSSPNSKHGSSLELQNGQQIGQFRGQSFDDLGHQFQSLPPQTGHTPDRHQQGSKQSHSFHGITEENQSTWDAAFSTFTPNYFGHSAGAQMHHSPGNEYTSPPKENSLSNNFFSGDNPLQQDNVFEAFQTPQQASGPDLPLNQNQQKASSSLQFDAVNLGYYEPPKYAVEPDTHVTAFSQDPSQVPAAFDTPANSQQITFRYAAPNPQLHSTKTDTDDVYSHQEGSDDSTTDEESDLDTEDQTSSIGDITDDEYSGVDNPEGGSIQVVGNRYQNEDSPMLGLAKLPELYMGQHGNTKVGHLGEDKVLEAMRENAQIYLENGFQGQRDFFGNVGLDNSDKIHQRKGTTQRSPKLSPKTSKCRTGDATQRKRGPSSEQRKQRRQSPVSVELFSGHGMSNHQETGIRGKAPFSRRENPMAEKPTPFQPPPVGPPKDSDSLDDVTRLFGRNPSNSDWFAKAQVAASSFSMKQESNERVGAADTQKEVVQGRMINTFTEFDQASFGTGLQGKPLPVLAQASKHRSQPKKALSRPEDSQQQHSGVSDENLSNGWVKVRPKPEHAESKKCRVQQTPSPVRQKPTGTPPKKPATKVKSGSSPPNAGNTNMMSSSGDSVAGKRGGPHSHNAKPLSQETRPKGSRSKSDGLPKGCTPAGLGASLDARFDSPILTSKEAREAFLAFRFKPYDQSKAESVAMVDTKKLNDHASYEVKPPFSKVDSQECSVPSNGKSSCKSRKNMEKRTSSKMVPNDVPSSVASRSETPQQRKVKKPEFGNAGQQLSPDQRHMPGNQTESRDIIEPVQQPRHSSGQELDDHMGQLHTYEEVHVSYNAVPRDTSFPSYHPSGTPLQDAPPGASFESLPGLGLTSAPSQAESTVEPEFTAEPSPVQKSMPNKDSDFSLQGDSVQRDLKITSSQAPAVLDVGNPIVTESQTVPSHPSQSLITGVKQSKADKQTANGEASLRTTVSDSKANKKAGETQLKGHPSRSSLPDAVFVPKLPAARSSTELKTAFSPSHGQRLEIGLTFNQRETVLAQTSAEKLRECEQRSTVFRSENVEDGKAFFDREDALPPADLITSLPPPASLSAHGLPSSGVQNYFARSIEEDIAAPSKDWLGTSSSLHSEAGILQRSESVISTPNSESTVPSGIVLTSMVTPFGQATPPPGSVTKKPSHHVITESSAANPDFDRISSTSSNTMVFADIEQNPAPMNAESISPSHSVANIPSSAHRVESAASFDAELVSAHWSGQSIAVEGAPKQGEASVSNVHPPDITILPKISDDLAQSNQDREPNPVGYGIASSLSFQPGAGNIGNSVADRKTVPRPGPVPMADIRSDPIQVAHPPTSQPAAVSFSVHAAPNQVPAMQNRAREGQPQQPQPLLQPQQPQPLLQPQQPQPLLQPQQPLPQLQPQQPQPLLQPQQPQPLLQPQQPLPQLQAQQPQPQLQPQQPQPLLQPQQPQPHLQPQQPQPQRQPQQPQPQLRPQQPQPQLQAQQPQPQLQAQQPQPLLQPQQPQPQLQPQQPQPQPQLQPQQPQPQLQSQQPQPQLQPQQPQPQLQPQQPQPQLQALQPQPQLQPQQPKPHLQPQQPQPHLQPQQPQSQPPQSQPQPAVLGQQQNTWTPSRPVSEAGGFPSESFTGQHHVGGPGDYPATQGAGLGPFNGQQSYGSLPQDPGSPQGAAPSGPSSMPSAMYGAESQGYSQPSSMDYMGHASQTGQQPTGMPQYGPQYPNPYAAGYAGVPSQMYNNYWTGGMPGYYDWYYAQWANYYHYNNYLAQQWEKMSQNSGNLSYQSSQQASEVDVNSRSTSSLAAGPERHVSYAEDDNYKPSMETPPPMERLTPLHFNRPHVVARSSVPGVTVITDPSQPLDGIPAVVHRIPSGQLLPPTDISEFPGPLVIGETSKKTVVAFARRKAAEYLKMEKPEGRATAVLWEYCALLVQRNGILDGADVADLLMQKAFTKPFSQTGELKYPGKQEVDTYRGLMLQGAKRDAINYAIREGLWGHAFTLASMGDPRSVKLLIAKFLSTVDPQDPLSTLYSHLGKKGAGSYPYIVKGAGDWIQHLCMILSNPSPELEADVKGIKALGDALLQDGQISGAHLCYLVAGMQPGSHREEETKMSLISQDHRAQGTRSDLWAHNDSIQLTEIFEFALRLQSRDSFIVAFQHFKCMYAMRLIGCGLIAEGFAYLQVVAEAVLLQPSLYTADLIASVVRMARNVSYLQASTPEDIPDWINDLQRIIDGTAGQEISSARSVSNQSSRDQLPSKTRLTRAQYESQSSSSSSDHLESESNTSLGHFPPAETLLSPSYRESDYHQSNETGSLYDSASQHGLEPPLEGYQTVNAGPSEPAYKPFERTAYTDASDATEPIPQYGYSGNQAPYTQNEQEMPQVPMFGTDYGQVPSLYDLEASSPMPAEPAPTSSENRYEEEEVEEEDLFEAFKNKSKRKTADQNTDAETKESVSASSSSTKDGKEDSANSATPKKGWLSGVFSKVFGSGSKEIHLPDSKMKFYFDKEKNRWIDPDEEEEETKNLPPPPPTMPYKGPSPSASGPAGPPGNKATPPTGPTTLLAQASAVMPANSAGTKTNPSGLPGTSRSPEPALGASQGPGPVPATMQTPAPMSGLSETDTPSGIGEEPSEPAAPPSIFSRKAHGFGRRGPRYVNTMGNAKPASSSAPLPGLFDPMAMNAGTPTNFFVPGQPPLSADVVSSSFFPPSSLPL